MLLMYGLRALLLAPQQLLLLWGRLLPQLLLCWWAAAAWRAAAGGPSTAAGAWLGQLLLQPTRILYPGGAAAQRQHNRQEAQDSKTHEAKGAHSGWQTCKLPMLSIMYSPIKSSTCIHLWPAPAARHGTQPHITCSAGASHHMHTE
jgi:hypothetical protein